MRALKLIFRFYKGIFLANFLVTGSCIFLIASFGSHAHAIITVLFWFKAIAMLIILFASLMMKSKQLYYYQSLGVSKLQLGLTTSVFDYLLFATLIITFITIR